MKSRKPKKIINRISSVTNGFVQAIIPVAVPTGAETEEALKQLGMTSEKRSCAYCGSRATDWDHLNPLVKGKRPSGHLHEARNLVPCCGSCNQSKSGARWQVWLVGKSEGARRVRETQGYDDRVKMLEKFEIWSNPRKISFEQIVGPEKWETYWAVRQEIEDKMKAAQALAEEIRKTVEAAIS